MRELSKPSTAQCNCSLYTLFLMAEPKYVSCVRLAEILEDISHDSVNRFLLRERYTPEDLFNEVKGDLTLVGGTLSVDDSVEDKPYRDTEKSGVCGLLFGLVNTNARSKGSISSRCTIPMSTSIHIPSTFAFTTNGRVKPRTTISERWCSKSSNGGLNPPG